MNNKATNHDTKSRIYNQALNMGCCLQSPVFLTLKISLAATEQAQKKWDIAEYTSQ